MGEDVTVLLIQFTHTKVSQFTYMPFALKISYINSLFLLGVFLQNVGFLGSSANTMLLIVDTFVNLIFLITNETLFSMD